MTSKTSSDKTMAFDKKKGTLAIMGDGKVRFLPADLPAATFRALCTIAGGDKIDSKQLDTIAPVVSDGSQHELKGGGGGLPQAEKPAPKEEPRPKEQPKEQPKQEASNNKGKLEGTKWSSDALQVQDQKMPAGMMVVEFNKDGTVVQTLNPPKGPAETKKGVYSLGSGDDVTIENDSQDRKTKMKETAQLVINGDTMTVTFKQGSMTFTRVK